MKTEVVIVMSVAGNLKYLTVSLSVCRSVCCFLKVKYVTLSVCLCASVCLYVCNVKYVTLSVWNARVFIVFIYSTAKDMQIILFEWA